MVLYENIYSNDFFDLLESDGEVYVKVHMAGFDMRSFNLILEENPRVMLTNFLGLKKALETASNEEVKIGKFRPLIEVILSKDEMNCKVRVNYTEDYLIENRKNITTDILIELNRNGIKEGVMSDAINSEYRSYEEFLVAQGTLPINGEDAKVKYYELSERKPTIRKDGTTNYYDLNLIDVVYKGDWLGEKIPPTDGKDGITVTGKRLAAKKGKEKLLRYDTRSIKRTIKDGKFVLEALVDGAVTFKKGKICVENHLVLEGDVDYSSGNIDFDGFVTVKGTVKDGFSIKAKHDISILSPMGIGATGKIHSTNGSIFIKGGVNGKLITVIEAQKDVYVKYCNETKITAGGKIDIGYYSIDCNLKAEKIFMDKITGRLIGGNVYVGSQIITGTIGNKFEKRTNVNVDGFDRVAVKKEFEEVLKQYKTLVIHAEKLKADIEIYDLNFSINNDDEALLEDYNKQLEKYDKLVEAIAQLDERRIMLQGVLRSRGEGQVSIAAGAYPKTHLELKRIRKKIDSVVRGTFYINGRELFFDEE
ncbi:DUF342 domain-containing protein [Wukongibacter sp. M2B1]|uniref:DUF342 domain-containing protein n=1 Tax=Wukongibacter sp. M2B1 TaxID=3088895 RepID=UPI003D7B760A